MRALIEEIYARSQARRLAKDSQGSSTLFICRDGGVGDLLCTLPALRVLRRDNPGRRHIYLCNRALTEIPRLAPEVDEVIGIRSNDRVARHLAKLTPTLAPRYADERPGSLSSPAESLIAQMARSMGVDPDRLGTSRLTPPIADTATKNFLQSALRPGRPIVAFHTGPTSPVRTWPEENWTALRALVGARLPGVQWMRVGPPVHFRQGLDGNESPSEVVDTRRALGGTGCLHAISTASAFIGVDSGLLHAAILFGVPAVGLFGPTLPSHRLPSEVASLSLKCSTLSCAGCHHRAPIQHWEQSCPRGHPCMREIHPEKAAQRILQLLGV